MWIRSQHKHWLGNYNEFEQREKEITGISLGNNIATPLGTYNTEERALEILNEIQKSLENTLLSNPDQYIVIYEMPKE